MLSSSRSESELRSAGLETCSSVGLQSEGLQFCRFVDLLVFRSVGLKALGLQV